MTRNWKTGVPAGEYPITVQHRAPWFEVHRNGECLVPMSTEDAAIRRAEKFVELFTPEHKAACPKCGRVITLDRDGALFGHLPEEPAPGKPRQEVCAGAGTRPGHEFCIVCLGCGEICTTCNRQRIGAAGCCCPAGTTEFKDCEPCGGSGSVRSHG